MKKLLVVLFNLVLFTSAWAQISDNAAKLQYQQAENAYTNSKYYAAANIALDLSDKMKSWTPKVLYLYLKSVHKSYTEPGQEEVFKKTLDNFKQFSEKCDLFFKIADKATYPAEKYNDIVSIQQYFKETQAQAERRSPAGALAFLNECAKRFPYIYQNEWRKPISYDLRFSLQDNYLHVSKIDRYVDGILGGKKADTKQYFVDLSRVDGVVTRSTSNTGYGTIDHSYIVFTGEDVKWMDRTNEMTGIKACLSKLQFFDEDAQGALADTNAKATYVFAHINMSGWKYDNFYPYLFFETTSQEFKEGDYANRIKEAFQYLIDYFPKAKKESKEISKGNGF